VPKVVALVHLGLEAFKIFHLEPPLAESSRMFRLVGTAFESWLMAKRKTAGWDDNYRALLPVSVLCRN
jgi:hypothetical protein